MRSLVTPSLAAGALVVLSASPGIAATTVAQASATGLELTVLSTPTGSGSYTATHDGTGETTTGDKTPLITAVGGQSNITVGTIAQDAAATVGGSDGRDGLSAACAGLAGDGAIVADVGTDQFCLTPGNNAEISAGTLDLTGVTVVESDLLAGLDTTLQTILQPILNAVLPATNTALQDVLAGIDTELVLDLGAVQSQCTADPSAATGDSLLTDASLQARILGTDTTVLNFPSSTPPNTKVLTDLDVVVAAINDALTTQLETSLQGALGPIGGVTNPLISAINDNVIAAVAPQLAPLEDNVLDGTINKQSTARGGREITVTALDVRTLPAASDFVDLLDVVIGTSSCGVNSRVADTDDDDDDDTVVDDETDDDTTTNTNDPFTDDEPTITAVNSGLAGDQGPGALALGGLAATLAVAGGAGVATYRRLAR
ncbi:MAG: hypothetical protein CMH83_18195 [Nocardioides sp.]|nr:hypothetical protein [Nocardioides sp.]